MNPRIPSAGVVDLSQLAPQPPVPAGAGYVQEVTEATFDAVIQKSLKHVVVLELTSPAAHAEAMSTALANAVNELGGAMLLGTVDVDAQPRIAQALNVTGVPMVVAVIAGQMVQLWQGTREASEIKPMLQQLGTMAAQNGLTGRAEPVAGPAADENAPDPRFAAADEALERGDFAAAEAEFDKLIAANPADAEAKAGKAQVSLIARTQGQDPRALIAAADSAPDDVDAQFAAADVEIAGGAPERGFARLIRIVREDPANKERARVRLLELFETLSPADPAVLGARRDLASALY